MTVGSFSPLRLTTIRWLEHIISEGDLSSMPQHSVVISGGSELGNISGKRTSETGSFASMLKFSLSKSALYPDRAVSSH